MKLLSFNTFIILMFFTMRSDGCTEQKIDPNTKRLILVCCRNYGLNPETKKCELTCNNCKNSNCFSAGVCFCKDGYEMDTNARTCEPVCTGCSPNGKCVAPAYCVCNEGYGKTIINLFIDGVNQKFKEKGRKTLHQSDVCQPICVPPCHNGECVRPNECECDMGYKSTINKFNCVPICNYGCGQYGGECVDPNKCQCPDRNSLTNDEVGDCTNKTCPPLDACKVLCKKGDFFSVLSNGMCIPFDEESSFSIGIIIMIAIIVLISVIAAFIIWRVGSEGIEDYINECFGGQD